MLVAVPHRDYAWKARSGPLEQDSTAAFAVEARLRETEAAQEAVGERVRLHIAVEGACRVDIREGSSPQRDKFTGLVMHVVADGEPIRTVIVLLESWRTVIQRPAGSKDPAAAGSYSSRHHVTAAEGAEQFLPDLWCVLNRRLRGGEPSTTMLRVAAARRAPDAHRHTVDERQLLLQAVLHQRGLLPGVSRRCYPLSRPS